MCLGSSFQITRLILESNNELSTGPLYFGSVSDMLLERTPVLMVPFAGMPSDQRPDLSYESGLP